MFRTNKLLGIVVLIGVLSVSASAQITRWNTGEVISGTEGITPGPGMNMQNWNTADHNLQYADFSGGLDLSGSILSDDWLDNARFNGANLTNVRFSFEFSDISSLTNADFSNANLTNASMESCPLAGANFSNANLTNSSLAFCPVTGADFTGATIRSTAFVENQGLTHSQLYSTASYQQGDLREILFQEINFDGFDFSGQNLAGTWFDCSHLAGADFSGAKIAGIILDAAYYMSGTDFTKEQLYSTESYQVGDLHGIQFYKHGGYDLVGWDLSGQNLMDSDLHFCDLTDTDLSRSDMRGAEWQIQSSTLVENTINPNGRIYGLNLSTDEELIIRDYSGNIAVSVRDEFQMESGSSLTIQFEDAEWGSTISLVSGTEVDLGGKLMLLFAEGTDVESLVGTTFNLFNWNGMLESGDAFACVDWNEWAQWDISDLYEGGTVTLTAAPEPASLLLLVFGSLISCRRRRMDG